MNRYFFLLVLVISIFVIGCSSNITEPVDIQEPHAVAAANQVHSNWGLWQFTADMEKQSLEVIQLRTGDFHLNALPFMEPPPVVLITLESIAFNGNIFDVDIGLRHPFLGLNEFTGFDVSGIFISNGSVSGFDDADLLMTGPGDTKLLNPDGLSRWWNPAEFQANGTMFGYMDGLLGAPDSFADYNCTLNGYKLFCDSIGSPNDELSSLDPTTRCVFSAGQQNVRHYTIEMGDPGLVFNYAVDACWQFPSGNPPWVVPDDFPLEANRGEAWNIEVTETANTLWNDGSASGGGLSLSIDVWDHLNAGDNVLYIESPGNFTLSGPHIPTGGGDGFSTYEIDISSATPAETEIEILVSVISEIADFEGFIPGTNSTAYFTHSSAVATEPPADNFKNIPLRDGVAPFDIAFDPTDGRVLIIYDDGEIWQYQPSDNYQFANPNVKWYDADWDGLQPEGPNPDDSMTRSFIDVTDDHHVIIDFSWYVNNWVDRSWYDVIDPSGTLVNRLTPVGIYFGVSYMNHECLAYGDSSSNSAFHNRVAVLWGHSVPWYSFYNYSVPADGYSTSPYLAQNHGYSSAQYGKNWFFAPWLRGAEVDQDDTHYWTIERIDFYAARWMSVTYDNAYFGTGYQTEADEGFYNPRDLTRTSENLYLVLDELSDESHRIKGFDVTNATNTIPAESLGGLDIDDIITGDALKMDSGDYIHGSYGNPVVVLHGIQDDPLTPDEYEGEYYMSFFFPSEYPW